MCHQANGETTYHGMPGPIAERMSQGRGQNTRQEGQGNVVHPPTEL